MMYFVAYITAVKLKKSLRTTLILSCLPPEKAIKLIIFTDAEQPYPPQKGRRLGVDPDFNKRLIIIKYSCMQSMMHK